ELRSGFAVALIAALVCAAFALYLAPRPGVMAALFMLVFLLSLGYTIPPLKLCYRALGELDVAITHSVVVLFVGYLLQGGAWLNAVPWLLALPLGISILPAIILSALPDRHADAAAGKGTLPIRLGARPATWLALAFAVTALLRGVRPGVLAACPCRPPRRPG